MATLAALLTVTPISDRTAAFLERDLEQHANDKAGLCRRCHVASCAVSRAALFELVMAGRRHESELRWEVR